MLSTTYIQLYYEHARPSSDSPTLFTSCSFLYKRQDEIHLLNSRPASLELFFILLLTSLLNEMFYRNTLSYAALTFILQLLGIVVS